MNDPDAEAAARSLPEWELFRKLLPPRLLNDLDPKAVQAVYTPWTVTWLLVYQRLNGNATLNDAVSEFTLRFPLRRDLSANSGAYSLARTELDQRVLPWAAANVYDTLVATYPPSWSGRRVFILDGTTVQLAPTPELRAAYPPASNQHGESHWPVLHLLVAHELASGLAAFPEFGPMYGPDGCSELVLATRIVRRLPKGAILLADRNFGIFALAWTANQAGHAVVLRLTQPRFRTLLKQARQVGPGRWELVWRPSRYDRKMHPELPASAAVSGWLHEVKVSEQQTLYLFETVEMTGEETAGLYHKRQDVETDIRDIKETLCLSEMTCKGQDMLQKELAAALVAFNLANQVRRLAAQRLKLEPRRLSFAGVWSLLKVFALAVMEGARTETQLQSEFDRLLKAAGQRKLPRREARSYPREIIARRRKFPTRKRPKKAAQ